MRYSLIPLAFFLCVAIIAGCEDRPAPEPLPPTEQGIPEPATPARPVAGPELPYRVEGACPFECCVYGTWTAERPLTAYVSPGDTSAVAFTVDTGSSFEADTGYVAVTQSGLVVVNQPMDIYRSYESSRPVAAGDTLYLLDYVGEGVYNAWLADSLYQIESAGPSGPAYRTLREPEQTWWVHAVLADGRDGWLWMDENENGAVRGYDGCG